MARLPGRPPPPPPLSEKRSTQAAPANKSKTKTKTKSKGKKQDKDSCNGFDKVTADDFDRWISQGKTIIGVDPGHKDLITAVRQYTTTTRPAAAAPVSATATAATSSTSSTSISLSAAPPPPNRPSSRRPPRPPPPPPTTTNKQKLARKNREAEANQSVYHLSNKSYYDECGFTAAAKRRDRWRQAAGLKRLDDELSRTADVCNSRTWQSSVYRSYVLFIGRHWRTIWAEASKPKHAKLRFTMYQKQQRAFATVAQELCEGKVNDSVVLWGGGSFGPTLSGHAAAPNKLLRDKLAAHGVRIYVVDEYGTSKHTACCHHRSVYSRQQQQLGKQRQLRDDKRQRQRQHAQQAQRQPVLLPPPAPPPPLRSRTLRGLLYCKTTSSTHSTSALSDRARHHHHGYIQAGVIDRPRAAGGMDEFEEKHGKEEEKSESESESESEDEDRAAAGGRQRSRPWKRDVSAAINILNATYLLAMGKRPTCFTRG